MLFLCQSGTTTTTTRSPSPHLPAVSGCDMPGCGDCYPEGFPLVLWRFEASETTIILQKTTDLQTHCADEETGVWWRFNDTEVVPLLPANVMADGADVGETGSASGSDRPCDAVDGDKEEVGGAGVPAQV